MSRSLARRLSLPWRWGVAALLLLGACSQGAATKTDPSKSQAGARAGAPSPTKVAMADRQGASGAAAQDAESLPFWPRFHGPQGDNLSTETGLLKKWPEKGPTLLWTIKGLGHGFASVSIA